VFLYQQIDKAAAYKHTSASESDILQSIVIDSVLGLKA
jgi:hypothetical protein